MDKLIVCVIIFIKHKNDDQETIRVRIDLPTGIRTDTIGREVIVTLKEKEAKSKGKR
jgi:hypothetical protein